MNNYDKWFGTFITSEEFPLSSSKLMFDWITREKYMYATKWLLPFSAIQLLRESPWFCTLTKNILQRGILWFVVQPSQIDISQHNKTKCMNVGDTGVKLLKIFPDSTLGRMKNSVLRKVILASIYSWLLFLMLIILNKIRTWIKLNTELLLLGKILG